MDEATIAALRQLGWRDEVLRGPNGQPYWAWCRDGHYFHIKTDSQHELVVEKRPYGDQGRKSVRAFIEPATGLNR